MSYATYETSTDDGRPAELYEFFASGVYYRYTSGAEEVSKGGGTFAPQALDRSSATSGNDPGQAGLSVRAFRSLGVAELFRVLPPSDVVTLTVYARHLDDPAAEYIVVWAGRVLTAKWSGNEVEFMCENALVSQKRNGLRRVYDTVCPYVLYSAACGVNANTYLVTASNVTVTGNNMYVASLISAGDGFYAGGYIEYTNEISGGVEFIGIRWSDAGNLTLALPPPGVTTQEIKIYQGCNHSTSDCDTKFNNMLNFGGQPYIPLKNPFGGKQIF
jgi:uncharacterized phage protein (TIGR02218 family)